MSKYWLVLAFVGAVGCAGTAGESAGSNQDTVKEGDGVDKGAGNASDPKGTTGASAPTDCGSELDALSTEISGLMDKYSALKVSCAGAPTTEPPAGTKDPGTTDPGKADPGAGYPDKPGTEPPQKGDPGKGDPGAGYPDKPGTEPPQKGDPGTLPPASSDPCAAALDAANAYLDEAVKSGDINLIIAAKEKYVATVNSCPPATTDAPPPKK